MAQTRETEADPRTQKEAKEARQENKKVHAKEKEAEETRIPHGRKENSQRTRIRQKTFGLGKLTESTLLGAIRPRSSRYIGSQNSSESLRGSKVFTVVKRKDEKR
jgi:hypothetical protein